MISREIWVFVPGRVKRGRRNKYKSIAVTHRHVDFVTRISEGYRIADIAEDIGKSPRTVEGQLQELQNIVGTSSLPHLVAVFFRSGLIK